MMEQSILHLQLAIGYYMQEKINRFLGTTPKKQIEQTPLFMEEETTVLPNVEEAIQPEVLEPIADPTSEEEGIFGNETLDEEIEEVVEEVAKDTPSLFEEEQEVEATEEEKGLFDEEKAPVMEEPVMEQVASKPEAPLTSNDTLFVAGEITPSLPPLDDTVLPVLEEEATSETPSLDLFATNKKEEETVAEEKTSALDTPELQIPTMTVKEEVHSVDKDDKKSQEEFSSMLNFFANL